MPSTSGSFDIKTGVEFLVPMVHFDKKYELKLAGPSSNSRAEARAKEAANAQKEGRVINLDVGTSEKVGPYCSLAQEKFELYKDAVTPESVPAILRYGDNDYTPRWAVNVKVYCFKKTHWKDLEHFTEALTADHQWPPVKSWLDSYKDDALEIGCKIIHSKIRGHLNDGWSPKSLYPTNVTTLRVKKETVTQSIGVLHLLLSRGVYPGRQVSWIRICFAQKLFFIT